MSESITITREDLMAIVDQVSEKAIERTLTNLGIKARTVKPWISQSEAFRLAGRKRVERAMAEGRVMFQKKDPEISTSRVNILRKDIEKLIREPHL